MEIPLNAQVECTDGVWGHSVFVLINPVTDQVAHVVVKANSFPNTEYIVPISLVNETITDTIRLHCSQAELEKLEEFNQTTFIQERVPESAFGVTGGMIGLGSFYYMPFVTREITVFVPENVQQIPLGELAVRRGTHVEATDGFVGKVDEFVVNPENSQITHLIMREGHLWGKKEIAIPIAALGETREDTVFLKINKEQVEALPIFAVTRRWS